MLKSVSLFLILSGTACAVHGSGTEGREVPTRSELHRIDEALRRVESGAAARAVADDSLKSVLAFTVDPLDRSVLAERIGRRYSDTQTDSAIAYFNLSASEARKARNASKASRAEALVAGHMASRGDVKEAVSRFEAIDTAGMSADDKAVYCAAAVRVLNTVTNYYPEGLLRDGLLHNVYESATEYLSLVPDTLPVSRYVRAMLASMDGNDPLLEAELNGVIRTTPHDDPLYAMAHEFMALHLLRSNHRDTAIPHLVDAVCAEFPNGVRTGASAGLLARELLDMGDSERGHALLQVALDNAKVANSRVRFMQVNELSPLLTESFRHASARKTVWIVVLSAIIVALITIMVVVRVRMRRKMKLAESVISFFNYSDEKRRKFFTDFLQMCALYIESLDDFTRTARRKMKAAQIDDLRKMIDSVDFFEAQAERFYKVFDSAFLQTFPHFVDDINRLLLPDRQVVPPEEGLLTTELRVMAFMRIGFSDSSRIARFLGLSVNTIYTYRNRMRSRAISRDTFEDDLMQTGLSNALLEK